MATSRSLSQFAKRMSLRGEQLILGVEKLVRLGAGKAGEIVVLATPVRTGLARGNWIPSIGSPQRGRKPPDKSGRSTIAKAKTVFRGYRIGGNGIFITNNVPYILDLENGNSRQAPNGMTALAIQAAKAVVKGQKVLKQRIAVSGGTRSRLRSAATGLGRTIVD